MSKTKMTLEDRQEIYDTLARYVWSMDTGDIEGVVATYTPDGVVKDATGKRWDAVAGGVRGFATHFFTYPNRRGGQHHVQHLFVDKADEGGYCVTSYSVSIRWDTEGDNKSIRAMGSYVVTCVTSQVTQCENPLGRLCMPALCVVDSLRFCRIKVAGGRVQRTARLKRQRDQIVQQRAPIGRGRGIGGAGTYPGNKRQQYEQTFLVDMPPLAS